MGKIVIYEYWYDYVKLKYREKTKLCYKEMDSCMVHVKSEDFYEKDLLHQTMKPRDHYTWSKTRNP